MGMPIMVTKSIRVWRNVYTCDECDVTWTDHLLTQGASWCPTCDRLLTPHRSEAILEPFTTDEDFAFPVDESLAPAPRPCPCGSNLDRRALVDAKHIFCNFVCDACESAKRAWFNPEIFTNPNYRED
jgi:hypothetical protein